MTENPQLKTAADFSLDASKACKRESRDEIRAMSVLFGDCTCNTCAFVRVLPHLRFTFRPDYTIII